MEKYSENNPPSIPQGHLIQRGSQLLGTSEWSSITSSSLGTSQCIVLIITVAFQVPRDAHLLTFLTCLSSTLQHSALATLAHSSHRAFVCAAAPAWSPRYLHGFLPCHFQVFAKRLLFQESLPWPLYLKFQSHVHPPHYCSFFSRYF
jgi:hypothetical protein